MFASSASAGTFLQPGNLKKVVNANSVWIPYVVHNTNNRDTNVVVSIEGQDKTKKLKMKAKSKKSIRVPIFDLKPNAITKKKICVSTGTGVRIKSCVKLQVYYSQQ